MDITLKALEDTLRLCREAGADDETEVVLLVRNRYEGHVLASVTGSEFRDTTLDDDEPTMPFVAILARECL